MVKIKCVVRYLLTSNSAFTAAVALGLIKTSIFLREMNSRLLSSLSGNKSYHYANQGVRVWLVNMAQSAPAGRCRN